jgi:hypothetical protein
VSVSECSCVSECEVLSVCVSLKHSKEWVRLYWEKLCELGV